MPSTKNRNRRYSSDKQAAADLANALQVLPDEWVICRDMRHAWRISQNFHVTQSTGRHTKEIARVLECLRCETLRKETYVHNGYGLDKISQSYVYPEGYQIKGVPRGVKPQSIVQEEQYRRMLEHISEDARKSA